MLFISDNVFKNTMLVLHSWERTFGIHNRIWHKTILYIKTSKLIISNKVPINLILVNSNLNDIHKW